MGDFWPGNVSANLGQSNHGSEEKLQKILMLELGDLGLQLPA